MTTALDVVTWIAFVLGAVAVLVFLFSRHR